MADGFKVADAYVELTLDKDRLKEELDKELGDLPRRSGPEADRSGRGLGDKLSQGMRMSLIRNSPLIVAAIAAALTAGGPLLATAATGLFAAVGIVAAAQAAKVQQSWLGAWGQIKAGAIEDSKPIQDVLVSLASTVADRFQSMRGALRGIFEEAAPQIAVFADGMLDLVQNSLPGFYRVIAQGMPVTQGFADFLGKVGTGFSDLFDRLATRAPAIGQVWSQLGDTFATLLPLLGELVGQGAELATHILPLLNGSLGLILDVATALGPMLPFVVAGFAGMKIAGAVAPMVERLGTAFGKVTTTIGGINKPLTSVAGGMGLLKAGASGVVGALGGPWGIALAAASVLLMELSSAFQAADDKQKSWTDALLAGGDAADKAAQEYQRIRDSEPFEWMADLDEWSGLHASLEEAQEDARKYLASLSPLEKAQHDIKVAQTELSEAVEKHGPTSRQAADAQVALSNAQREAARIANEEEAAIRGVTEAMLEQVDAARGLADKQFAMEDALKNVADLTEEYTTAVREHGKASDEAADALDALERGYRDAGRAASDLASSGIAASVDDQTKAWFGARAELDYYKGLLAQGIDLPPELDTLVAQLERQAGGAISAAAAQDVLAGAISDLGVAVNEVPGEKAVTIKAEGTEDLRAKLAELGFTIERLPNGEFKISSNTPESDAQLTNLLTSLATVDTTNAAPDVHLEGIDKFYTDIEAATAWMLDLDGARANPDARLESSIGPQTQTDLSQLEFLDQMFSAPGASLETTVTPQAQADVAALGVLGAQHPTPVSDLDSGPLQGVVGMNLGMLGNLAGQRPTPIAGMLPGNLPGTVNNLLGQLGFLGNQRPTPSVSVLDYASGPLVGIANAINRLPTNKTINVNTNYTVSGSSVRSTVATGGKIGDVIGLARGGQASGKVKGPGTTTSDSVGPYQTTRGWAWLSNFEWIVKAASAMRYGDERMTAVNNGTARILLPGEQLDQPIRRQIGGPLASFGDRMDGMRQQLSDFGSRAAAGVREATQIHVGNLTVKVETPLNLMAPADLRKAALILRAAIIGLERETS